MSYKDATAFAASLAATLMVSKMPSPRVAARSSALTMGSAGSAKRNAGPSGCPAPTSRSIWRGTAYGLT